MKRLLLTFLISAAVVNGAQRFSVEDKETIRRTLEFSASQGNKVLEVDNVTGSIRVTGYDGKNVEMVVNKTIRAVSQEKIEAAKQDVKLDIREKTDTINIFVDEPDQRRAARPWRHTGWRNRDYEVGFDFEIRVPRETEVRLWTVNGTDITVRDVAGNFDVSNVNGRIGLHDVSGSGRAYTVNGSVTAAFRSNPKSDSEFGTINGNIEVSFQPNLSADLRFKTFHGGIYTDFPTATLPLLATAGERRNGKFVYKSNGFSGARVGKGGPEIKFDGFNSNIRILEAK